MIRYHRNGKVQEKLTFREGKLIGEPIEYDEKGMPKGKAGAQPYMERSLAAMFRRERVTTRPTAAHSNGPRLRWKE